MNWTKIAVNLEKMDQLSIARDIGVNQIALTKIKPNTTVAHAAKYDLDRFKKKYPNLSMTTILKENITKKELFKDKKSKIEKNRL